MVKSCNDIRLSRWGKQQPARISHHQSTHWVTRWVTTAFLLPLVGDGQKATGCNLWYRFFLPFASFFCSRLQHDFLGKGASCHRTGVTLCSFPLPPPSKDPSVAFGQAGHEGRGWEISEHTLEISSTCLS